MLKKSLMVLTSAAVIAGSSLAFAATTPATPATGDRGAKMFEKMDSNSDGFVSKDEYLAKTEKRFEAMDTNKDGKISKDEFKAHHEAMKEKRAKKKAE
jgi:Ca2+-binding EF-hand superfamily protein